jgi:hypothetical protein
MGQGAMLRFLELVRKELGADDARAELGGRDPDDPCLVWTNLAGGWRLIGVFDTPPADRAAVQAQLDRLVEGFSQTVVHPSSMPPAPTVDVAFRRLDVALEALRSRTGSVAVVLVDVDSPVLWGSSEPQRHADEVESLVHVGRALDAALHRGLDLDAIFALDAHTLPAKLTDLGVDYEQAGLLGRAMLPVDGNAATVRHHLLTSLAVARVRRKADQHSHPSRWVCHEKQFGYFARCFANIYLLIVVFEGPFSELHVESAVVHAMPSIEALVFALPPFDPPPAGRVVKLRR